MYEKDGTSSVVTDRDRRLIAIRVGGEYGTMFPKQLIALQMGAPLQTQTIDVKFGAQFFCSHHQNRVASACLIGNSPQILFNWCFEALQICHDDLAPESCRYITKLLLFASSADLVHFFGTEESVQQDARQIGSIQEFVTTGTPH